MTIFIPALLAVLLAEFGGRAAYFVNLPRLSLAATLLGLAVGFSAFAGASLAPTMPADARALLLGVALVLTGCGQFGTAFSGEAPVTFSGTLLFVWRSSAPFLAFAFAVWEIAAVGAAAGALAGIGGAAALGSVAVAPTLLTWMRRSAGTTIIAIGIYVALGALRVIA